MNVEKYLPVGTVVLLEDAKKRLMITGFCMTDNSDKENPQVYDYSGCLYPEGLVNSNQIALFNHDQIAEIYHMGYSDEEEKAFKEKLNEYLEKADKGEETTEGTTEQKAKEDSAE